MKTFFQLLRANQLLIFLTVIGGILRFYRLEELTTFGGDQGVDYQNVARMIVTGRPSLLGPTTHVGVYLGPLYYYLLIPFFLIFNLDPIAAPFLFALIGTATVALVYLLARKFLDPTFSFLAAFLYAISPIILESSRAPSQPHLIPFLSVLLLISMIRIIERKATKWDAISIGIVLGSAIQFHYLTFPMYAFTLLFFLLFYFHSSTINHQSLTIRRSVWLAVPALALLAPWLFFELRHKFFITNQIISFLGQGDVRIGPAGVIGRFLDLSWFTIDRLLGQGSQLVTLLLLFVLIIGIFRHIHKKIVLLAAYGIINLLGLSLYLSPLSNHYISALYPAAILLVVIGLTSLFKRRLALIPLTLLVFFNFMRNTPFRAEGYTMPSELNQRIIKEAARTIANDRPPTTYEVANILDGDTRAQPYRYLLTYVHKIPPMDVHEYPAASVLYVIGRKNEEVVLAHTVWEIWSFTPKVITKTWPLTGTITLYKLERTDVL